MRRRPQFPRKYVSRRSLELAGACIKARSRFVVVFGRDARVRLSRDNILKFLRDGADGQPGTAATGWANWLWSRSPQFRKSSGIAQAVVRMGIRGWVAEGSLWNVANFLAQAFA